MRKQKSGYFKKVINLGKEKFDLLDFFEFNQDKYPYLLESSAKGNKSARFSIIFSNPELVLTKNDMNKNINFLYKFDQIWKRERIIQKKIKNEELPFFGGWFIYLGYELASEIETNLKLPNSPFPMPVAFAARVKSAVIKDEIENKLFFISDTSFSLLEEMYNDFISIKSKKIRNFEKKLIKIKYKGSEKKHASDVKKCIQYIFQGDIFQANLSRLWEFEITEKLSDSQIYRELRKSNPSPFGGIIKLPNTTIISSSPERLIRVLNNKIETRPIAGTRPRGFSGVTDVQLLDELISSNKERAEHLMLVDLERNDISRVCIPGSVKVNEMMVIESYSHVHHIVSNITGVLKENMTPGKMISAVFPGGTITGCPKVKCMEILGDLEKVGRGPYTGSFGYVNHSGDLDLNILIRTMLREKNKLTLRAGGGIVADSIPEKEILETEAKANGMLKALQKISG